MLESEGCLVAAADWGSAPREVLVAIFCALPLKERCQVVSAVCTWWRDVALDTSNLLLDLNLNRMPLFATRSRSLPDFLKQRASFVAWLLRRRPLIKRLSLTAERWEDDSQAVILRLAVAEIVAAQLESLRLVCTDSGRATSAFLTGSACLRELQLDYWGRSNSLPRAMADCTALTKLGLQCSGSLEHYKVLGSLRSLQDLSIVDCDWQRIPADLLQLPLTRLHLRFADFADGSWLPAACGRLVSSLQDLALPGCQISEVPEDLSQLAALTRLVLDRNYFRRLPDSLSGLRCLETLSCEGCASMRELPPALAEALPLRSLNLLHTGVAHLPLAAGARPLRLGAAISAAEEQAEGGSAPGCGAAAEGSYLSQLTELRWGVAEWEQGGSAGARRWVTPGGALPAGCLPDLSPVAQASSLRVLQLSHVPSSAEEEVAALRLRLPLLSCLQVNSAVLQHTGAAG